MSMDLPNRWTRKNGAIYYQVPSSVRDQWDGKTWFRLGATEEEAFATWNQRIHGDSTKSRIVTRLIDDWIRHHVNNPKRVRPATTRQYLAALKHIRPVFGRMDVGEIRRSDIKKYYMKRYDVAKTAARREFETLSAFLSYCLDQDVIEFNPAFRLNLPKTAPRKHYVEDYDVQEFIRHSHDLLDRYIPLKIYTGARKNDLLSIKTIHWNDDGLYIGDRKSYRVLTGESKLGRIFQRTEALEEIMDLVMSNAGSEWVFETQHKIPYIDLKTDKTEGFDSIWQRTKQRALASGKMKQCFDPEKPHYTDFVEARALKIPLIFQERDLRAKTATDSESIVHAQQRLGHSSTNTTQRVYNRKPILIT